MSNLILPFNLWYQDLGYGNAGLHCEVFKWGPSVRKALDIAADNLQQELVDKGFHTAWAVGPVHPKFCLYMGGEHIKTVIINNENYEVFKWELLHQS